MYENSTDSIIKAQNGDQDEMTNLIQVNNRTNMEYSKKIFRKGI